MLVSNYSSNFLKNKKIDLDNELVGEILTMVTDDISYKIFYFTMEEIIWNRSLLAQRAWISIPPPTNNLYFKS